ncbi:MAG: class III extradiol ring-cleavage dioxygenase [Rhizomicrobium sp.]
MRTQPVFYLPHGGGPCFFMPDPDGQWTGMAKFLASLPGQLPQAPKAILIVSGHWEADGFAFSGIDQPGLIYDYYGFPQHTYALTYPVPGAPWLAREAAAKLKAAGLKASIDPARGLDHGVFIPLKVAFPEASVPVVEMSLDHGLDPALHIKAGAALKSLRNDNVLIIATGMSFHNMRGYGNPNATAPSQAFDQWLTDTLALPPSERSAALTDWEQAPAARLSHPREEHLIPVMLAAGAAEGPGTRIYNELVLRTALSAFRFD